MQVRISAAFSPHRTTYITRNHTGRTTSSIQDSPQATPSLLCRTFGRHSLRKACLAKAAVGEAVRQHAHQREQERRQEHRWHVRAAGHACQVPSHSNQNKIHMPAFKNMTTSPHTEGAEPVQPSIAARARKSCSRGPSQKPMPEQLSFSHALRHQNTTCSSPCRHKRACS